ncbi:MAG: hypothetical protein ACRD3G_11395 [Vicinamibacterales bacterium]
MRNPTPLPPNGPITAATFATQRPGTVFPATSRAAATYDSQEYHNLGACGLQLVVDVNDVGGAGTVTVSVLARDPATGLFVPLPDATTAAIAVASQVVLSVHPALTEDAADVNISVLLPHAFKVRAVVGGNAVDFSVGGTLLP